ncbi:MAG: tryptophan synthase subunit alpha [Clostridium sp.]
MKIKDKFNELREKNKKAFIGFITLGDPTLKESIEIARGLEKSGVDILEIGIPYSDPLADGNVIQNSYYKALNSDFTIEGGLETIKEIRGNINIPIVVMVYYTIVFCYGREGFLEKLRACGVNGIIIPDLPLEERGELIEETRKYDIDLIPLVAPTSKERIKKVVENGEGFVYCVSVAGTTGERNLKAEDLKEYLEYVRESTDLPLALGFGISSKEAILEMKSMVDGVIMGSAIVKRCGEKEGLFEFVKECCDGLN